MAYDAQLNAQILAWLRGRQIGQQHGNGQCWTLAEDALRASGGRTSHQMTPNFSHPNAPYIWGDPELNFANIQPGDIIQISAYHATALTTIRDRLSPPAGRNPGPPQNIGRGHHTALVWRIISPGNLLEIIEQNVGRLAVASVSQPGRVVQINPFALRTFVTAPVTSLTSSGDPETTTVVYTVTAARFLVYHPKR